MAGKIQQFNFPVHEWADYPNIPAPIQITLTATKGHEILTARFDPPGAGWHTFSVWVLMDPKAAPEPCPLLIALPGHHVDDTWEWLNSVEPHNTSMVAFLFHRKKVA